jgi:hypothetical protein
MSECFKMVFSGMTLFEVAIADMCINWAQAPASYISYVIPFVVTVSAVVLGEKLQYRYRILSGRHNMLDAIFLFCFLLFSGIIAIFPIMN